jgi:dihydrofolate reductase
MRKIIVLSFVSLDGVAQAPGGPEEDTSLGFRYGGWTVPLSDEFLGNEMLDQMGHNFDLLLGRRTYEIFAGYWPKADPANPIGASLNKSRKYVVSTSLRNPSWENTIVIKDHVPEQIRKIKEQKGPELQVHGSLNLIQTLMKHDLVDELWLKIYPVMLGSGKKLFEEETKFEGSFTLLETKTSPSGVIIANYRRNGEVKTGSF